MAHESPGPAMHTIPIDQRPPHGPLASKIFFPFFFILGQICGNAVQILALPLLLIPFGIGRKWFDSVIGATKDWYGGLLIFITVVFAPTSLIITTDAPPSMVGLVERDPKTGVMTKINLPDRLVVMGNHQAYTDWMYLWILACYCGHSRGIIILLKASFKNIPVIGWGMQFFKFIFMNRSWAADREHLALALTQLAMDAQSSVTGNVPSENGVGEASSLLATATKRKRSPLWLLIFPEGTITSDEERVKSVKYAEREQVDDFVTLLHPRTTGILFCLRTLLPQIPDLQLLDVTIGYPGVPYGKYPQNHYGLASIFYRSVPPPTVHIHLHLYSDLSSAHSQIPSLITTPAAPSVTSKEAADFPDYTLATPDEARKFELWLRGVWTEKEKRLKRFFRDQTFESGEGQGDAREVVPIRQMWYHWGSPFVSGPVVVVLIIGAAVWQRS